MTDLIHIPFRDTEVLAVGIDGKPYIVLKPFVESLGLDYPTQVRKVRSRSWAVVGETPTTGADGKTYRMTTTDVRTALMLLATVNESRVPDDKRALLVAYQSEVADVIEAYWTRGGAISPRATEHQVNALIRQSQMQMELCQAAKGLIHPDHLEARARIVLARGLGEAPAIEAATRPLYTQDYLREKNLSSARMKSVAGVFGKRVKKAYIAEHDTAPERYPLNLSNGQIREVNAYTEADRPLMDQVWEQHYAAAVPA